MNQLQQVTIDGVSIGDQFIDTCHRKSKIVSTVVDFIERKSVVTGEIIGYEVVAEHRFMGQLIKSKALITTVKIHKLHS